MCVSWKTSTPLCIIMLGHSLCCGQTHHPSNVTNGGVRSLCTQPKNVSPALLPFLWHHVSVVVYRVSTHAHTLYTSKPVGACCHRSVSQTLCWSSWHKARTSWSKFSVKFSSWRAGYFFCCGLPLETDTISSQTRKYNASPKWFVFFMCLYNPHSICHAAGGYSHKPDFAHSGSVGLR